MPSGSDAEKNQLNAATLSLVDLALTLAAEAAEVCGWFASDHEPDRRPARCRRRVRRRHDGPWYEFGTT